MATLQDQGYKVAIVTDGRMSGASGKVPAAIHLAPEAVEGGIIAKIHETKPDVVFAPHVETSAGVLLPKAYLESISNAL